MEFGKNWLRKRRPAVRVTTDKSKDFFQNGWKIAHLALIKYFQNSKKMYSTSKLHKEKDVNFAFELFDQKLAIRVENYWLDIFYQIFNKKYNFFLFSAGDRLIDKGNIALNAVTTGKAPLIWIQNYSWDICY